MDFKTPANSVDTNCVDQDQTALSQSTLFVEEASADNKTLFGRGYTFRYLILCLRNVLCMCYVLCLRYAVPCNKRIDDICLGNQTIKKP